ncbi:MAG TPA: hypothetical protein VN944_07365 [Nitrospiria bacterium]|nr:hypothetical protein [Nitrospiria bacterium]
MKIIGLELEGNHLRVAELEEQWSGSLRLLYLNELSLQEKESVDPVLAAKIASADQIIVNVSGQKVSSRVVEFPFSDPKKIGKALPFEMEQLLPFEIDAAVLDVHPLSSGKEEGKKRLLAAAVLKKDLQEAMAQYSRSGIDPHQVEWEPMALYNFSRGMIFLKKEPVLLLRVGLADSCFCFIGAEGEPLYLRSFSGGMDEFSDRGAWNEQSRFFAELQKTLKACRIETGSHPAALAVCGAGGENGEWTAWISKVTGIPVLSWNLDRLKIRGLIGAVDPLYVPVLGLALKGTSLREQVSRINFRRDEFVHAGVAKGKRGKKNLLLVSAAVLLILVAADLGVRFWISKNQYERASVNLRSQYLSLFPGGNSVVSEVDQTRGRIGELKKREAFLNLNEATALQILHETSVQVPKEVRIDVNNLSIDPQHIRLEGETDSFDQLEKIKGAFEKDRLLHGVAVRDVKMNAQESRVRFKMEIQRSETEEKK